MNDIFCVIQARTIHQIMYQQYRVLLELVQLAHPVAPPPLLLQTGLPLIQWKHSLSLFHSCVPVAVTFKQIDSVVNYSLNTLTQLQIHHTFGFETYKKRQFQISCLTNLRLYCFGQSLMLVYDRTTKWFLNEQNLNDTYLDSSYSRAVKYFMFSKPSIQ